jgi:hypothetical protein
MNESTRAKAEALMKVMGCTKLSELVAALIREEYERRHGPALIGLKTHDPQKRQGEGSDRSSNDRQWLLAKLRRAPKLEAEILRPQDDQQRRMARMFWQLEVVALDWLKAFLGDAVDNPAIRNHAAHFNAAATEYLRTLRPTPL